jgi:uncharacterized membrane protein
MLDTIKKANSNKVKLGFDNKLYKVSSLLIVITILLALIYSYFIIKSEIPVTPKYEEQLLHKLQSKDGNLSKEEVQVLLNTYGKYKILQMLFTQEFIEESYTYEEFLLDYKELKDKPIFKIALLYEKINLNKSSNKIILNQLYNENKRRINKSKQKKELIIITTCLKYVLYKEIIKNFRSEHIFYIKDIKITLSLLNFFHIWIGHGIDYKKDFNIIIEEQTLTKVPEFNYSSHNLILDLDFLFSKVNSLDLDINNDLNKHNKLYFKFCNLDYVISLHKNKEKDFNITTMYIESNDYLIKNFNAFISVNHQTIYFYGKK